MYEGNEIWKERGEKRQRKKNEKGRRMRKSMKLKGEEILSTYEEDLLEEEGKEV